MVNDRASDSIANFAGIDCLVGIVVANATADHEIPGSIQGSGEI